MLAQTAGSNGGQESQQHMCEPQVLLLTVLGLWLALHFMSPSVRTGLVIIQKRNHTQINAHE
jgi:hypothetical protein